MTLSRDSRIFGIGLPKSGTSTLHSALEILGYRSIHNPDDPITTAQVRAADYRLDVLNRFDALMDNPIPAIFAQLDACWPNSKFILTIRPQDAWLESSRKAGFNQSYATPKAGSTVEFHRALLFGCNVFSEARYRWVYESHHHLVKEHFTGAKADQLLIMHLNKETGWDELCAFLDKSVPDVPFPHANAISAREPLSPLQQKVVGGLVKLGVDYRLLRKFGNKIRGRGHS